ncbi:MAG: polysaccharide deacetylase family protein, partial [Sneathiella sp.]
MGKKNDDMPICDKELVRKTSDAGHEIGCHTYGHLSCQAASLEELQNDLSRNEEIIKNITNIVPSSFAYPFGKVSFSSRTLIGQRFSVARGIHEGLNSGKTDLLNLKANAIYSNVFSKEKYIALLQQAKKEGGWLIFYTHDVTARPGKFGCTPEEFQTVVNLVAEAGVRVLPVKHAAGYFAFQK